jgi:hypothetical protein
MLIFYILFKERKKAFSSWKNIRDLRVESYVKTDGQSASMSWNKAPIWGLRQDLYYYQTVAGVAGLLMWGALSDEWTGLSFTGAAGPRQLSHSWVRARGTRDHILLSQIRDFPLCRLLRLAGRRWRYSTPPPHGIPGYNVLMAVYMKVALLLESPLGLIISKTVILAERVLFLSKTFDRNMFHFEKYSANDAQKRI